MQLEKLAGCNKIFKEKKSGTTDKRPRLKACLEYVRDGDTLVITRLDRLARSTLDLCKIAKNLEDKGVDLIVLDQSIDTSTATGRLMFNMLGAIGQFETEIRAERQMEGIVKAKKRGVAFGRQQKITHEQQQELKRKRENGVLIKNLMREYRLSKASVYRYLSSR